MSSWYDSIFKETERWTEGAWENISHVPQKSMEEAQGLLTRATKTEDMYSEDEQNTRLARTTVMASERENRERKRRTRAKGGTIMSDYGNLKLGKAGVLGI